MKIDRRSFLAFGVGGAAGTALSPLPWKLTDDSSIWSQRWPWVPIPVDGKIGYAQSTCMLCPGGCGITVRKIDDRPVKIEGQEGHPVNQGGICILGMAGLQFLYGPSRVKTPLKRTGKRGQGQWAQISWEAALNEVAEKLGTLRADGRPQGLACMTDTERGTIPALLKRFMTVYGSPNFIGPASAQDAQETAVRAMAGVDGTVGFDVEKADLILSFGSGLLDGWGSPVRMFQAYSNRQDRKTQIVQIDSRLSNTAAKSDRWISINPGTEGTLALGLAYHIIAKSFYNKVFVDNFSAGFDSFKQKVMADFSPAKVAEITGVPADIISELALQFATAHRPLAICGRGRGSAPGALSDTMAVLALNALVGSINSDGGVRFLPDPGYIFWPDPDLDPIALKGNEQSRLDGAGTGQFSHTRSLPNRFFEQFGSDQRNVPEIMLIADANPLYTLRDTKAVQAALDQIPFIVSFSSFMDETAQQADLILPNHTFLERYQDVPAPAGFTRPFIGLARPVVAPQYNTRHLGDVIIALAGQLKGTIIRAFGWDNYLACLKDTLDERWEGMIEKGFWMDDHFSSPSWDAMFTTGTGRFEFNGEKVASDPWTGAVAAEGDSSTFPLILVPYDSIRLAGGSIGNPPFMMKTVAATVLVKADVFVEINPETARKYQLNEGTPAMLTTPKGEGKVRIHLSEGIMPGLVAMPTGLGHTAFDDFLAGKGVNVNELVGPVEDAASGFDAAWGIRAKLAKA